MAKLGPVHKLSSTSSAFIDVDAASSIDERAEEDDQEEEAGVTENGDESHNSENVYGDVSDDASDEEEFSNNHQNGFGGRYDVSPYSFLETGGDSGGGGSGGDSGGEGESSSHKDVDEQNRSTTLTDVAKMFFWLLKAICKIRIFLRQDEYISKHQKTL